MKAGGGRTDGHGLTDRFERNHHEFCTNVGRGPTDSKYAFTLN